MKSTRNSGASRSLRNTLLSGMMGLALIVSAGCEKDNNNSRDNSSSDNSSSSSSSSPSSSSQDSASWGVSHYSKTGVVPEAGNYDFSAGGNPGYFEVTSGGSISFSIDNYAHYSVSVNNGAFYYKNGLLVGSDESSDSGNMYPTDGFCIGGHFTTPTTAEGEISYASAGKVTDSSVSFTATKK